jgi:hypothetical protein
LYNDYENQGKLIKNLPYESQHGQGKIWFHHDHFTLDESEDFLRLAFEIDYSRNGASLLRAVKTAFAGYLYCQSHLDERVRNRSEDYRKKLKMTRNFLLASTIFVQNRQSEILLKEIKQLFRLHFGRMNILTIFGSMIVVCFSIKEYLRCRIAGDARTPKTSCRSFNTKLKSKPQPETNSGAARAAAEMAYGLSEQTEY